MEPVSWKTTLGAGLQPRSHARGPGPPPSQRRRKGATARRISPAVLNGGEDWLSERDGKDRGARPHPPPLLALRAKPAQRPRARRQAAHLRKTARAVARRIATESCWNRCLAPVPGSSPSLRSLARANRPSVSTPVGPHPPEGSATRGMNAIPCCRHTSSVSRWCRLTFSYSCAASPLLCGPSARAACLCGEETAKSKAAGAPWNQEGM